MTSLIDLYSSFSVDPETIPRRTMRVITPYRAYGFSLAEGDEVEEVSADKDGFTNVKNFDGKEGLVPSDNLGKIILWHFFAEKIHT